MAELTLIYFEGCPNAGKARTLLESAGKPFREICQDDLADGHPHKAYTSPSILLGNKVVFGMSSDEAGCTVQPFDEEKFLADIAS